ncbi:MAG: hypothetical protein NZM42_05955 [Gemmatales bacterium]|nr:hypothetical protein [Gemmatales bacterium]MDW8223518.1 hypothetical protein [Gemmatales bacterium]
MGLRRSWWAWALWGWWAFTGLAQDASHLVAMRETVAAGDLYRVSCRVRLEGTLRLPAEKEGTAPTILPFQGNSQIDYVERILEVTAQGEVRRTLRVYEQMTFQRRLGQQEQKSDLRPAARRMVIVRHNQLEVPFSPDGPLLWSEIDRVRTDVFPPALTGLLPSMPVKVGEKWQARREAMVELTDLEKITQGHLVCCLERLIDQDGNRLAQVSLQGTVVGISEDGASRHHLQGFYYFDLDGKLLTYISLEGKQALLDSEEKVVSEVKGQFVMTRQRLRNHDLLSDQAIRGLTLVPNEENTRLLFDEPELGLRFIYPRRWTVRRADARQVVLDEPNGGSILLTLDSPGHAWTAAQYQNHVEQWLAKEKATVHRRGVIRGIAQASGRLEHFQYEVSLRGERLILDYYAYQHPHGSVTLAARIPTTVAKLSEDVALIAQSLRRSRGAAHPPEP